MKTRDELIKSARETVAKTDPEVKDLKVTHAERFFSGMVVVIDYVLREQKRRDYVYFDDAGAEIHSQNFEAFLKSFADKSDQTLTLLLYSLGGLLAIAVVGTVCYLAASGAKIPDVLGAAVTTILGFFFGTVAAKKAK